jgi:hypothetical protein
VAYRIHESGCCHHEVGVTVRGKENMALMAGSTLFWAGKTFAPSFEVPSKSGQGKVNIQQFLQDSFLAAYEKLVEAVGDLDSVMGFEVGRMRIPLSVG